MDDYDLFELLDEKLAYCGVDNIKAIVVSRLVDESIGVQILDIPPGKYIIVNNVGWVKLLYWLEKYRFFNPVDFNSAVKHTYHGIEVFEDDLMAFELLTIDKTCKNCQFHPTNCPTS